MAYYAPRATSLNNAKDKKIKDAMDRKEKFISKFADNKSTSIAVSSAFNNSSQICVALILTNKLEEKDFWKKHKEIYKEYLKGFATAQIGGARMYNKFVEEASNRHQDEVNTFIEDLDDEI